MPELTIKKSSTIADFERYLGLPDLGKYSLAVPNAIKEAGALGCSLAFAQFLLTWSRTSSNPEIRTFLRSDDEDAHKRFVQRVDGFTAAYLSNSLSAAGNARKNLRNRLLVAARERIVAMHKADLGSTSRGTEIELIFVEGARNEFHGSLYSKAPNSAELADREAHGRLVRTKEDLNHFLHGCFRLQQADKALKKHLLRTDLPFGSLLAESFRNTAEHAYTQPDGTKLERNMRCVRIARTPTSRNWIQAFNVGASSAQESAERYFTQLAGRTSGRMRANVDMIEMSIFDSGKGFSSTMGASLGSSDSSQVELVNLCFRKHRSAKPQKVSGVGIYRMLSAVNALGGFMRIRTSSAEAFYPAIDGFRPDMNPEDFVHGGLSPAEGTLITVGIPVAF